MIVMNKEETQERLEKLFKYAKFSNPIIIACYLLGGIILSMFPKDSSAQEIGLIIWYIVLMTSLLTFYISMGKIVSARGKSKLLYCGLCFLTGPVGAMFGYYYLRKLVYKIPKEDKGKLSSMGVFKDEVEINNSSLSSVIVNDVKKPNKPNPFKQRGG